MANRLSYYVHAYARGVDKRNTFKNDADYSRFFLALTLSIRPKAPNITLLQEYIDNKTVNPRDFTKTSLNRKYGKPKVNILSAVLMPNHFHLHIKFNLPKHSSTVLQRTIGSYSKYFNIKYDREGRLFSSTVKKVAVVTDEQNLYLNKYIHINPIHSTYLKINKQNLHKYKWSTYPQYIGKPNNFNIQDNFIFDTSFFCDPTFILKNYKTPSLYKSFIFSEDNLRTPINPKILIDGPN